VAITVLSAAPLLAGVGGGVTTGDLALQLARAAGIALPSSDPQAALESLGKAGIKLGNDLKAPVTEKVLVQVGLAVGLRVSASRPEAAITPAMGSAFIRLFKEAPSSVAVVSGQSETDNVSCQGRESRADRQGTPASPSDPNATADPCEDPGP
jgi:hypothetical protein